MRVIEATKRILAALNKKNSKEVATTTVIKRGTRLQVINPVEVGLVIEYLGPYSDGCNVIIDKGISLEVIADAESYAPALACRAINKSAFETKYLPSRFMEDTKYAGFHIVVKKQDIEHSISKVDEV